MISINESENLIIERTSFKLKIVIALLSLISLSLLIAVIILSVPKSNNTNDTINEDKKGKDENQKQPDIQDIIKEILKNAGYEESWNKLYGEKIENISYAKNDVIINSFKKGGKNYNETMGEINKGKDYTKNERNFYNLYIPYSTEFTKDKYNGVILFIHGGAWISGNKEDMEYLCSRYSKYGYITATLSYTLLVENYTNYNIYRIIDEITACVQSIKEKLKERGFDENKLELAVGGTSAGGHLSLLYGYSIKNSPIPVKFIIDIVGPISLEPKYWYKVANFNEPLDSILPKDIEDAINKKAIVKVFEDESAMVGLMNLFLGKIYTDDELKEMVENNLIKSDNPKYQNMYNIVQNSFPVIYINNNTVPTLCEYGGKDPLVGVIQYQFLEKSFEKHGIKDKIQLVYMKYGGHELASFDTENGVKAMRDFHYKILEFAKKYFTSDNI